MQEELKQQILIVVARGEKLLEFFLGIAFWIFFCVLWPITLIQQLLSSDGLKERRHDDGLVFNSSGRELLLVEEGLEVHQVISINRLNRALGKRLLEQAKAMLVMRKGRPRLIHLYVTQIPVHRVCHKGLRFRGSPVRGKHFNPCRLRIKKCSLSLSFGKNLRRDHSYALASAHAFFTPLDEIFPLGMVFSRAANQYVVPMNRTARTSSDRSEAPLATALDVFEDIDPLCIRTGHAALRCGQYSGQ